MKLIRQVFGILFCSLGIVAGANYMQKQPTQAVEVPQAKSAPVVEMPTYTPTIIKPEVKKEEAKPVPKGHHEKRWVEGAWRWVWFEDSKPVQKKQAVKVYSSGGCANGQCSRSRGWFGRR